jgi:hypothetical protein
MIFLAVGAVTICHPGLVFRDAWHATAWTFRKNKKTPADGYQMTSKEGYESGDQMMA